MANPSDRINVRASDEDQPVLEPDPEDLHDPATAPWGGIEQTFDFDCWTEQELE